MEITDVNLQDMNMLQEVINVEMLNRSLDLQASQVDKVLSSLPIPEDGIGQYVDILA